MTDINTRLSNLLKQAATGAEMTAAAPGADGQPNTMLPILAGQLKGRANAQDFKNRTTDAGLGAALGDGGSHERSPATVFANLHPELAMGGAGALGGAGIGALIQYLRDEDILPGLLAGGAAGAGLGALGGHFAPSPLL